MDRLDVYGYLLEAGGRAIAESMEQRREAHRTGG
jgi:hypothetical protein